MSLDLGALLPISKGVRFPRKPLMSTIADLEEEVDVLTEKSDEYLFALKEIIATIEYPSDILDTEAKLERIRELTEEFRQEDV